LGSKTEKGRFPSTIALHLKKVCYKVSLRENRQRQSCVEHSLIYLSVQKWLWVLGDVHFYLKFWPKTDPIKKADYQPIFVRSASAVTPSEK